MDPVQYELSTRPYLPIFVYFREQAQVDQANLPGHQRRLHPRLAAGKNLFEVSVIAEVFEPGDT